MTSICHNHGYSWDKYNFQNKSDSKGQSALEHQQRGGELFAQRGGEPFDTQRDREFSEVNYQRSYDLLENINVMVIEP
jgi:hypothetical protein